MSISEPEVEITCDHCQTNSIWLALDWSVGGYNYSDNSVRARFAEMGWILQDGKHICDECHDD